MNYMIIHMSYWFIFPGEKSLLKFNSREVEIIIYLKNSNTNHIFIKHPELKRKAEFITNMMR